MRTLRPLLVVAGLLLLVSPTLGLLEASELAGGPECADLVDNDSDGATDLEDPNCRAAGDNDESSFASAIPGDDLNDPSGLDCWFDLNSGNGDDDCDRHACCGIEGACPADLEPGLFDAGACPQSSTCLDVCIPLTKADCDCFGCCDVCVPGSTTCRTVYVHPVVSPGCSLETLTDPGSCRPCQRDAACLGQIVHLFSDGFESEDTSLWSTVVPSALSASREERWRLRR